MKRTTEPPRNVGRQAGEPGSRCAVTCRQRLGAERRAAPQGPVERLVDDVVQIEGEIGVERAEAQAVQEEPGPRVRGQGAPVPVDLGEQRARHLDAVGPLRQQGQGAVQVGVLRGHRGDVAALEVLERVDRRGIDPAGPRRGGDDQELALEAADADELSQRESRALLGGVRAAEAHVDADRRRPRYAEEAAQVLARGTAGDEAAALPPQVLPVDPRLRRCRSSRPPTDAAGRPRRARRAPGTSGPPPAARSAPGRRRSRPRTAPPPRRAPPGGRPAPGRAGAAARTARGTRGERDAPGRGSGGTRPA